VSKKDDGQLLFPEDLSGLKDDELASLEERGTARADQLADDPNIDSAGLTELTELADNIERVRSEKGARAEAAAAIREGVAAQKARVHAATGGDEDDEDADVAVEGEIVAPTLEPVAASGRRRPTPRASLGQVAQHAPDPKVEVPMPTIVASANIPGYAPGDRLNDVGALTAAMHAKARHLPDSQGAGTRYHIAQLKREYKYVLDPQASPKEISDVLTAATNPEILTAAGGWCAPSEIRYDLFNIICEDGILDLPTVGIRRGGIRWPVSPTYADIVAGSDGLWRWNETQDVAAATGTAQSGTKTCVRIPCVDFEEERLLCDGICVTAGNLMSDAYPELIDNFTNTLMVGHAHYMNSNWINTLVAGSTAVTYNLSVSGHGVVIPVMEAVDMQAVDYREKYRMCEGALLEVVMPRWIKNMMRADYAKRTGIEDDQLTDAAISAMFTARNVKVQYVSDWQLGTTGYPGQSTAITAWPTSLQFMLYAPGTWVRGTGMTLDLGIVRDSTMNETNDFTAAWMEECYLIAKFGHESRLVTVPVCANGVKSTGTAFSCSM
jgi:hypothetical protein